MWCQGVGDGHRREIRTHVEEVVRPLWVRVIWLRKKGLRLGDFIAVMGEQEIDASRMDIQLLTEHLLAHGRTFNMPSWTTRYRGATGRTKLPFGSQGP